MPSGRVWTFVPIKGETALLPVCFRPPQPQKAFTAISDCGFSYKEHGGLKTACWLFTMNFVSMLDKDHCLPELYPLTMDKLWNISIMEWIFHIYLRNPPVRKKPQWKGSTVCSVFKTAFERSSLAQSRPIVLFTIISKFWESILNKKIVEHP